MLMRSHDITIHHVMLPDTTPDSKSDTFTSVLPGVEDVLECMYKLAEGGDTSIDEVVTKVRSSISLARLPSLLLYRRLPNHFSDLERHSMTL